MYAFLFIPFLHWYFSTELVNCLHIILGDGISHRKCQVILQILHLQLIFQMIMLEDVCLGITPKAASNIAAAHTAVCFL